MFETWTLIKCMLKPQSIPEKASMKYCYSKRISYFNDLKWLFYLVIWKITEFDDDIKLCFTGIDGETHAIAYNYTSSSPWPFLWNKKNKNFVQNKYRQYNISSLPPCDHNSDRRGMQSKHILYVSSIQSVHKIPKLLRTLIKNKT